MDGGEHIVFQLMALLNWKKNFIINLINQNYCEGTNYEEKKHFLQQYGMWDSLYTENTILGMIPDFANTICKILWKSREVSLHLYQRNILYTIYVYTQSLFCLKYSCNVHSNRKT